MKKYPKLNIILLPILLGLTIFAHFQKWGIWMHINVFVFSVYYMFFGDQTMFFLNYLYWLTPLSIFGNYFLVVRKAKKNKTKKK